MLNAYERHLKNWTHFSTFRLSIDGHKYIEAIKYSDLLNMCAELYYSILETPSY